MLPLPRAATAVVLLTVLLVLSPGAAALQTAMGAMRATHSEFYGAQNLESYSALQLENSDGLQGRGINIAIISTGVDNAHPTLTGSFRAGRDLTTDAPPDPVTCPDPDDVDGSGTYFASLALGRGGAGVFHGPAGHAGLVDVRVAASAAGVTRDLVAQGIDWVIDLNAGRSNYCVLDNPVRIILVPHSLGHADVGDDPTTDAIRRATEAGILVVVPAGDGGRPAPEQEHTVQSPGASPDALTVGAVEDNGSPNRNQDHLLRSTSRGSDRLDKPDVVAPGANVTGARFDVPSQPWGTSQRSGTAAAASLVAGLAAQAFEAYDVRNVTATPEMVKDVIMQTAQDDAEFRPAGRAGWDPGWGAGYVDAFRLGQELLNRAPVVSVLAYPNDPIVGELVLVDASGSRDPDGDTDDRIVSYTFDWGDGTGRVQGTDAIREHEYRRSGTYTITVRATDTWGATTERTVELTVEDPPQREPGRPPVPRFTVSPLQPVVGQRVVLDASGSADPDDDIVRFEWDLDHPPGSPFDIDATGPRIEHAFTRNGTVHVAVRVWDSEGHRSDGSQAVDVFPQPPGPPPPPTVRITHPAEGDVLAAGEHEVFWVLLRGAPYTYVLSVDGREVGSISNIYGVADLEPGPHTISVRATDELGRTGSDAVHVTVEEPPAIAPGAGPLQPTNGTAPNNATNNTTGPDTNDTPAPAAALVLLVVLVAACARRRYS